MYVLTKRSHTPFSRIFCYPTSIQSQVGMQHKPTDFETVQTTMEKTNALEGI
jgi:hypothetical protein